jgi:hypothetical protein
LSAFASRARSQVGIMIVVYLFDGEKVLELRSLVLLRPLFPPPLPPPPRQRVYLLKFYPRLLAAAGARMGVGFLAAPKASGTCSQRARLRLHRQSRRSKLNSHVNTNNCSWASMPPATWISSGQLLHPVTCRLTKPGQISRRI